MSDENFGTGSETHCSPYDPYSRAKLGWIDPIEVTDSLSDQPIAGYMSEGQVYKLTHSPWEYFLVTNHKLDYPTSQWEEAFPGQGLLIWHIDTTGNNAEHIDHKLVDVETADGLWDSLLSENPIKNDSTGQDSIDASNLSLSNNGYYWCFFNNTTKQAFNNATNPTTDGYLEYMDNNDTLRWKQTILTGKAVMDIQGAGGDTMWADFYNNAMWWGPDTVFLSGDFVVESGWKLHVVPGTVVKFAANDNNHSGTDTSKCEIIISGVLEALGNPQDSIYFVSASANPSDSAWYGIKVNVGASATFKYCNLNNAYSAIRYFNSTSDSVVHCHFRNNYLHGIRTENSALVVKDCIIEKNWAGTTNSIGYGIVSCGANCNIKNTFFEGMEYGIKIEQKKRQVQPTTSIEECGFYNLGNTGIWSSVSNPSIKKCCFKGTYGQNCLQIEKGVPNISQCYMASEDDSIPIGILFTGGATGTVRRTTIWDYNDNAVKIDSTSHPDFGKVNDIGCNWFEEPDSTDTNKFFIFTSNTADTIQAYWNFWESENDSEIQSHMGGLGEVNSDSCLGHCMSCYPYYASLCADLPPSDPLFYPCKIAAPQEGEKHKTNFFVSQNYPNPFNPVTIIRYNLPQLCHVVIEIYNVLGQKVRTVVDEDQAAGSQNVFWDGKDTKGKDVASGIYFYKITAGVYVESKQMILLR